MVKKVQKFEADDGTLFDTEEACAEYEDAANSLVAVKKLIVSELDIATDSRIKLLSWLEKAWPRIRGIARNGPAGVKVRG